MSRWVPGAAALAVAVLLGPGAQGQETAFRGHVKLQQQYVAADARSVEAALGYRQSRETSLDLRLIGTHAAGRFRFDAAYLLRADVDDAVALMRRLRVLRPALSLDRTDTAWLGLDDPLANRKEMRAVQSLDRLSVSYTTERWVFALGRQAYTWGNGIVFRPLDLFDPFAPDAVDESYKPGVDALYAQRLFADGSDLTTLIVPRRNPATGALDPDFGSAAVKWHGAGAGVQLEIVAARDYGDTVLGLGLAGAWDGAVWRVTLVPERLVSGHTKTSLVANVEHAWQRGERNLSGFAEYYRNGFGRSGSGYALDELDADLLARLARGQVFDTGRDYVALGLRMQLTPLLEVDPVLIANLGDHSRLLLLQGNWSVAQNLGLDFGVRAAVGATGTEFGGLRVSAGSAVLEAPAARFYMRLARYF